MNLSGLIGRLAWACFAGIVAFLIVLGIGLLIVHFLNNPSGTSYGNEVKGQAVIIGLLVGIIYFFVRPTPTLKV